MKCLKEACKRTMKVRFLLGTFNLELKGKSSSKKRSRANLKLLDQDVMRSLVKISKFESFTQV